jgi:actin
VKGIDQRLLHELEALTNVPVRVHCPEGRQYSVWEGGSVMASLKTFAERWITKEEYQEFGASIVHRKCF